MIVKSVTIYVKQDHIEEFIKATKENKNNSLKEEGIICLIFFNAKMIQLGFYFTKAINQKTM
ncbi:quinol monooxygenase YgiN [Clostridium beijerinckii]|nr:quinol monooxygenase YgiN [Clostridium beijerinckii]